jgi:hypothetical protein
MPPAEPSYPRSLTAREREWVRWILPEDRTAYRRYREMIDHMTVIGEGRRGPGELILGQPGATVDFGSPLGAVFAYGALETNVGQISVTLRELTDEQISLEIVSHRSAEIPADVTESRRWSYSTWSPGQPCPQCRQPVREVPMHSAAAQEERLTLAVCPSDRRLWVHDGEVNRLIPVTNYYNELMLQKKIRDPKIALDARRLFAELDTYSDADLTRAFVTYNQIRSKVRVEGLLEPDRPAKRSVAGLFRSLFGRPA